MLGQQGRWAPAWPQFLDFLYVLPFGFVFLRKGWEFGTLLALDTWLGILVVLEQLYLFYFKDIFFKNQ